MAGIEEIEGVGPAYAEKLSAADVNTVEKLLATGATPAVRKKLAKHLVRRVGSEAEIEKWIAEAKGLERAVHY